MTIYSQLERRKHKVLILPCLEAPRITWKS